MAIIIFFIQAECTAQLHEEKLKRTLFTSIFSRNPFIPQLPIESKKSTTVKTKVKKKEI